MVLLLVGGVEYSTKYVELVIFDCPHYTLLAARMIAMAQPLASGDIIPVY